MIHLSTINEEKLTSFNPNHFILSVTDLKNTAPFKNHDLNNDNHISIETCRRLFPSSSNQTIASLMLTTLQIKIQQGKTHFLFVFNEKNKAESFDVVNGLIRVFNLTPSTPEQEAYFSFFKAYAFEWTHILIAEDKRLNKISSIQH
ncbi:hypothetical protein ACFU1R_06795 [Priestia megaterium]|uniref:hypothetical protein n=1 Tax=Priestia megaterium TaxID=1404 RepID=UPI00366C3F54